ncbi:MAG: bifunctional 5,6,7,8-tetrahydromethanopterin hydro-lyase/3-hexulose-6-phosphate synthase [Methanomicrobiales archaeon]|nr:bifunctional 5,6,7,8-tetrahydromethanopterin hydro-lyase/3-hexulose-6-phosphate synthase [Methanomicrobiales archaeon]
MYLVGEALVGDGAELAHVDLILGNKDGAAGAAFANAFSQFSMGHTPLLAVIRPNLLAKPATLVIPKVTIRKESQVNQVFGPVQSAVAKAVADSVEEGVFKEMDIEQLVLLASVFIHPTAKDYNKLYRYNYGATKLAIRRAIEKFPDPATVQYEKDRHAHPIMGFKVTRLWNPPYLQIALDIVDMDRIHTVITSLPENDHLIIEAGTPMIKKFGVEVISELRKLRPNSFIIADLKILDTGNLETRIAFDASADAVVISGLAPKETLEKAINEAKKTGIYSIIDMLNVSDPVKVIKFLTLKPDIVELHRAIDAENADHRWGDIEAVRKAAGKKVLIAIAGGIKVDVVKTAMKTGADILVVGRAITMSNDVHHAADEFLEELSTEEIDQFRVMTDF